MADDPLYGFKPVQQPSSANDPLMGFKPTAPTPASAPTSPDDIYLQHAASWLPGAGLLHDVSAAATDWPTFGLMDKLFGKQAQDATAASHARLGAADLPVSIAGSMMTGGPELKAASAIGDAIGLGRVGSAIGSGAVGAGSGALGAYGHEAGWTPDVGDIAKGAAISGALGTAGGALSGPAVEAGQVAGRQFTPRALPAAQTSDQLAAEATKQYEPLSNILYDAGKEVHPALDVTDAQNALRDWSGYKWGDASKTSKEVKTLLDKPQLSANDLQQSQSYLKGIASNPLGDANDKLYAGYYADKLQGVLENGLPFSGVRPDLPPGVTPSNYAAYVKGQGDLWHGRAQDMATLENMQAKAAVTGGPDVGKQSSSYLTSAEGQRFASPGSPQYQGWNTVAGTASQPEMIPWYVKHFMLAPMAGALGNEFYAGMTGTEHSPMEHIAADLGVGAALMGATAGYGGITGRVNALAQQRAVDALKSTIATGAYQAPLQATTPYRNALRMLLFGQSGR